MEKVNVEMDRVVADRGRIIAPRYLFAIRRRDHGHQVVCHRDGRQQEGDQDQIGYPRRGSRVDAPARRGFARASGRHQKHAESKGQRQPRQIEQKFHRVSSLLYAITLRSYMKSACWESIK